MGELIEEFDVRVTFIDPAYEADVNDLPCRFDLPMTADDVARFDMMLRTARSRDFHAVVSGSADDVEAEATRLGTLLFEAMFRNDTQEAFIEARSRASALGKRVRLRLHLDKTPELINLPWELMFHAKRHVVFTDQPYIVRHVSRGPESGPAEVASVEGPLRILVVTSVPPGLESLDVGAEYAALETALAGAIAQKSVHLERLDQPDFTTLAAAIAPPAVWHVVHYIGHGDVGATGGILALVAPDGTRQDVSAEVLGRLFNDKPALRLVVLNACRTAAGPSTSPLSGVGYELIKYGAPAAIAMQFPISDAVAILFAKVFYGSLAGGLGVDGAIAQARQQMQFQPEWMTPVLMLGTTGALFDIPTPTPPPPVPPAEVTPQMRVPPELLSLAVSATPRAWIVETVRQWTSGSKPLFVLRGALGAGKSVVCAQLVAAPAADAASGPRVHAAHFFSSYLGNASTDARSFVLNLSEQLTASVPGFRVKTLTGEVISDRLTDAEGVDSLFTEVIAKPLQQAHPTGPVVIIVDGLDEADAGGDHQAVKLVGRLAQLDVRVLVTESDDSATAMLPPEFVARRSEALDLSAPEHREAVLDDVERFLLANLQQSPALVGATPPDADSGARAVRDISRASQGNFEYAAAMAAHLGDSAEGALSLPSDLGQLYEARLRRLVEHEFGELWPDGWTKDLEPLLGSLAVAAAPVPAPALEAWLDRTGPQIHALCARFRQIIRHEADTFALVHPAFAQFLLAAGPDPRRHAFEVDALAAHRRIVDTTLAWANDAYANAKYEGGEYGLVYVAAHIRSLIDAPASAGLLDRALDVVSSSGYRDALEGCVTDPVMVGKPYRDLAEVLAGHQRTGDVGRLVRCVAKSSQPAVRQSIFDMLITAAANDPTAAASSIVELAIDPDATLADIGLRATSTLPPATQASVFRDVVTSRDNLNGASREQRNDAATSRRIAAAYALYANGLDQPDLIRSVLDVIVKDVTVLRPVSARAPLEFFVEATVTNYINQPDDPTVIDGTSDLWRMLFVERLPSAVRDNRLLERVALWVVARRTADRIWSVATGADDDGRQQIGPGVPGADSARRVIETLDPAVDLSTVEADLAVVLDSDIPILRILGGLSIAVHNLTSPETTAPIVERLFGVGGARRRLWLLLAHAVVLPTTPRGWVEQLEAMTRSFVEVGDVPGPGDEPHVRGKPIDLVFCGLSLAYAKAGLDMAEHQRLLQSTDASALRWRTRCLHGIGVVGLYHPDRALAEFDRLVRSAPAATNELIEPLALISGLHPLKVRAWTDQQDVGRLTAEVTSATDVAETRRHLEALGFYNNAVNLNARYEKMRTGIGKTVFSLYLESSSRREWSKQYMRAGIKMLRDAEFELKRWTLPD